MSLTINFNVQSLDAFKRSRNVPFNGIDYIQPHDALIYGCVVARVVGRKLSANTFSVVHQSMMTALRAGSCAVNKESPTVRELIVLGFAFSLIH